MLVLMKDNGSDDAGRRGDIIVVRPDGWQWGREECPPIYQVVKVDNISEKDAKKYEDSVSTVDTSNAQNPKLVTVKLRKYSIDLSKITTGNKVTIAANDVVDKEK